MPIIERIRIEPIQSTYFFGRNRTIHFIVITSWLPLTLVVGVCQVFSLTMLLLVFRVRLGLTPLRLKI